MCFTITSLPLRQSYNLVSASEASLQGVYVCVSLDIYPVYWNILRNAHEIKHMMQNTRMLMVETTTVYYTSL